MATYNNLTEFAMNNGLEDYLLDNDLDIDEMSDIEIKDWVIDNVSDSDILDFYLDWCEDNNWEDRIFEADALFEISNINSFIDVYEMFDSFSDLKKDYFYYDGNRFYALDRYNDALDHIDLMVTA